MAFLRAAYYGIHFFKDTRDAGLYHFEGPLLDGYSAELIDLCP